MTRLGCRFLVSSILLGVCYGCSPDFTMARDVTLHRLSTLAEGITISLQEREKVEDLTSLENAVRLLTEKGYVKASPSTRSELMQDYWKRPFEWELSQTDGKTRIRILSRGPNGILENGQGDDLFVEILVRRGGDISWRRHPER